MTYNSEQRQRRGTPTQRKDDVCPAAQAGKASEYNLDAIEDKVRVCQAELQWQVSAGQN